ncbi:DUF2493 domain-containing protein [Thermosulfurimonas sp. F29]|uniref:DUF2493 domain-containing protein n=1 Tax=Thermosulfurimonas sp. F29 TaxID=2867247 RepID=UPI001C83B689|nr:DUF2493 domain-containing protein [Thermosulfurimonas sp. F29]MBX6424156.1 DUF2493 domain-containing protein [Thermosulfurimonas sp. F29]
MKICVCGSRSITDRDEVFSRLDRLVADLDLAQVTIIAGGAKGVDHLAKEWAKSRRISFKEFPADWDRDWDRYSKRADKVRNRRMAEVADLVIALWDGVSTGTAHMVVTAHELGKPVRVEFIPADHFSIWFMLGEFDAICVTTNGFVVRDRKTGKPRGVMGRGVAYQTKVWLPDVEYRLGDHLLKHGNVPGVLGEVRGTAIVSFPVKETKGKYPCEVVSHAKGCFKR